MIIIKSSSSSQRAFVWVDIKLAGIPLLLLVTSPWFFVWLDFYIFSIHLNPELNNIDIICVFVCFVWEICWSVHFIGERGQIFFLFDTWHVIFAFLLCIMLTLLTIYFLIVNYTSETSSVKFCVGFFKKAVSAWCLSRCRVVVPDWITIGV